MAPSCEEPGVTVEVLETQCGPAHGRAPGMCMQAVALPEWREVPSPATPRRPSLGRQRFVWKSRCEQKRQGSPVFTGG